jgi:hypothetical protein
VITAPPRLCKDCRFAEHRVSNVPTPSDWTCTHATGLYQPGPNLVTGGTPGPYALSCAVTRSDRYRCGPGGRHWEALARSHAA